MGSFNELMRMRGAKQEREIAFAAKFRVSHLQTSECKYVHYKGRAIISQCQS